MWVQIMIRTVLQTPPERFSRRRARREDMMGICYLAADRVGKKKQRLIPSPLSELHGCNCSYIDLDMLWGPSFLSLPVHCTHISNKRCDGTI